MANLISLTKTRGFNRKETGAKRVLQVSCYYRVG